MISKRRSPLPRDGGLLLFAVLLLAACGGGGGGYQEADTSSLVFSLAIHDDGTTSATPSPAAALLDCLGEGLATVEAHLYDQDNALVKSSERWSCADGRGTIDGIPAGRILTIVAMGRDAEGEVLMRGEKSGIYIVPNGISDAGVVDCYRFVPELSAPGEGVALEAAAVGLSWEAVAHAAEYGVEIYEAGDPDAAVIHETTRESSYAPAGLLDSRTYRWRVYAVDAMGNRGGGSAALSFATIGIPHLGTGDLMGAGGEAGEAGYSLRHALGETVAGTSAGGAHALATGFLPVVRAHQP